MTERHELTTTLWRWTGSNGVGWFFITIDGAAGEAITATALMRRLEGVGTRGFGSVKVRATIGQSCWSTSVFPAKEGGYMLPVKVAIRKTEGLSEGDEFTLVLEF